MFAIKCGEATHHSRSEHHWAKPISFAVGKHHSKKPNLSGRQIRLFCCEIAVKMCVNVGKKSERMRKSHNAAFDGFPNFFFRLFAVMIKR